jgi:Flp pilus assembly protein TadB
MNKKHLLILEITWAVTGLLCIAAGIRYAIVTGGSRIFIFIIMAVISFLFAWKRHRERKKS